MIKVMLIEWKEEYNVNIKKIDNQHRYLVDLINGLNEVVMGVGSTEKVDYFLAELTKYSDEHFKTEEYLFDKFGYPEGEEHKRIHKEFLEKVKDIENRYKGDKLKISFDLLDFLEDWFVTHLITEDKKYVPFLKGKGVS